MAVGTRFGEKRTVPVALQLKHRFLIWRLKRQEATEAAVELARAVPRVLVPMHVHHEGA